jgi:quercetin dioxygenase-like cupin family protein
MSQPIKFQTIDWTQVEKIKHLGETGHALWQTLQLDGSRIRLVEYSKNYKADHWCAKGHIVHCLEGSFVTELNTGEQITLTAGMSYVVSDDQSLHRSTSEGGVKLLIVDGEFLGGGLQPR